MTWPEMQSMHALPQRLSLHLALAFVTSTIDLQELVTVCSAVQPTRQLRGT